MSITSTKYTAIVIFSKYTMVTIIEKRIFALTSYFIFYSSDCNYVTNIISSFHILIEQSILESNQYFCIENTTSLSKNLNNVSRLTLVQGALSLPIARILLTSLIRDSTLTIQTNGPYFKIIFVYAYRNLSIVLPILNANRSKIYHLLVYSPNQMPD